MKKIIPFFFAALLSCSPVHVLNTEAAIGFKLDNYKTFDFYKMEASGDTTANFPANVELLKLSIEKHLQTKGLQRSTNNPDLLINIGVVVEDKIQTRATTLREAPRYMGQRNYSWQSEEVEVGHYKQGTVTVHLVEPGNKSLIWNGTVSGVLPSKSEKIPATIEQGMTALFEKLNNN